MKKIFNYLLLSAAAMTAMLAVSCDPTEQEDPTTEEPSQEQLVVPEGELIAFEKITPAEITMRSISATFEAEGDCAKIIRGFCLPNENNIIDWDSASDDEIVNVLKDLAMTNTPYYWTGTPFTEEVPKDLTPGLTVYVYAAAITADGKIGKLCYEKMVSETPSLEGTGTVDVDFVEEEPLGTFRFAVELGNGATAARIIACDNSTYAKIQNDMDWVFTDPEQSYLWVEVTADELAANEGIVEIADRAQGTKYYVFAVAISEDGVSPVATFEEVTSKKEEVVIEKINYDLGIGKANIEATSTTYRIPGVDYGTWQEPDTYSIDVTYTITKGENTEKVYLISCENVVKDDIESIKAIIASDYETKDDYVMTEFTEFGVPLEKSGFDIYYNPALVVITVDTAGNYAIADYYIVEYDEEGAIERPTE